MRLNHRLSDKDSHPSSSYNLSRLVPCQQPETIIELVQLIPSSHLFNYDKLPHHNRGGIGHKVCKTNQAPVWNRT